MGIRLRSHDPIERKETSDLLEIRLRSHDSIDQNRTGDRNVCRRHVGAHRRAPDQIDGNRNQGAIAPTDGFVRAIALQPIRLMRMENRSDRMMELTQTEQAIARKRDH
ncbi:hypothetical protein [Coleofasciculus sp. E1-EBD-02]|uniref:hypothetical protein n=1 Tax=Coleofasciculus sp. E1-EBD-02 TaxID=3068481 RepID=UPI003300F588